jgi:hypothetical protein
MSSAGGSFGHASVHVGEDWEVRCSAYPAQAPILTVDAGSTTVSITIAGQSAPGPHAVEFARELVAQAGRFAAVCERFNAAALPVPAAGMAADDKAAGSAVA